MSHFRLDNIIPDEIRDEILVTLLPKTLCRFKCVSTQWRSLISSRSFVDVQLDKMKELHQISIINKVFVANPPICYMIVAGNNLPLRRSFPEQYEEYEILGSYNGLLLTADIHDLFFIKNPSTNQSLLIPNDYPIIPPQYGEAWLYFGFGYDAVNDDYVIMRIARFFEPEGFHSEIKLFSRNSNSWICLPPFPIQRPPVDNACFVGGLFHWKVYLGKGRHAFVTFDCTDLSYGVIDAPTFLISTWFISMEAIDENSLGFYASSFDEDEFGFSKFFFEMNILTYSSGSRTWSKVLIFKEHPLPVHYDLVPICFTNSSRTSIMFRENPFGRFCKYDTEKNVFQGLPEFTTEPEDKFTYKYIPSLVSPFRN